MAIKYKWLHRTAAGLDSGIYSKWKEQAARRTGIMRPLSGQPPDRAGCTGSPGGISGNPPDKGQRLLYYRTFRPGIPQRDRCPNPR